MSLVLILIALPGAILPSNRGTRPHRSPLSPRSRCCKAVLADGLLVRLPLSLGQCLSSPYLFVSVASCLAAFRLMALVEFPVGFLSTLTSVLCLSSFSVFVAECGFEPPLT